MNQILNLFRCSKSVQILFLLQKYDSFCFYHLHSIHPINTTINDKAENIQKTGEKEQSQTINPQIFITTQNKQHMQNKKNPRNYKSILNFMKKYE